MKLPPGCIASGIAKKFTKGNPPLAVTFIVPVPVVSEANTREHWRKQHKRKQAQKLAVVMYAPTPLPKYPATVTLTRIGKRDLDDDNLASAFKAMRDQVAAMYAVDDGPKGPLTWQYRQRRGEPSVEIGIESTGGNP